MLLSRVRGSRWPADIRSLDEALDQVCGAFYGLGVEEIRPRSSAAEPHRRGARAGPRPASRVDDQIIPVRHAELLRRCRRRNPLVRVWVLPAGGHGAIDAVDERWAYAVYRRFFERWARYPDRPTPRWFTPRRPKGRSR